MVSGFEFELRWMVGECVSLELYLSQRERKRQRVILAVTNKNVLKLSEIELQIGPMFCSKLPTVLVYV